jgi:nucleoside-diphosphate-sugar epimerase
MGNISRRIVAALQNRNHEVALFNCRQHRDAPPPDVRIIHDDQKNREDFETKVSEKQWDAAIKR